MKYCLSEYNIVNEKFMNKLKFIYCNCLISTAGKLTLK